MFLNGELSSTSIGLKSQPKDVLYPGRSEAELPNQNMRSLKATRGLILSEEVADDLRSEMWLPMFWAKLFYWSRKYRALSLFAMTLVRKWITGSLDRKIASIGFLSWDTAVGAVELGKVSWVLEKVPSVFKSRKT